MEREPMRLRKAAAAVAVLVSTGGAVIADSTKQDIPLDCVLTNAPITELNTKLKSYAVDEGFLQTREMVKKDRKNIKGCEVAKAIQKELLGTKNIQKQGKYDIEFVNADKIDGGVEVYARVWEDGRQLGFGPEKDVDVERFLIYNPPILVESNSGNIVSTSTDPDGNEIVTRYTESPRQAIIEALARIVDSKRYKSSTTSIKVGSVGETTSTVYPDEDRGIHSGGTSDNRDLNPQYIQRNSGDVYRSLIDFTFPADPGGETIDSVTVSLVHNSQSGTHTTVDVHEITKAGYNLLTATWNTYNGSNSWTTAGGDFGGVMDTETPGTGTKTWDVYGAGASNDIAAAWSTTFHFIFKYTNDTTSPASNWWGHYASEQTGTANDPFVTIESSVASGGARRVIRTTGG